MAVAGVLRMRVKCAGGLFGSLIQTHLLFFLLGVPVTYFGATYFGVFLVITCVGPALVATCFCDSSADTSHRSSHVTSSFPACIQCCVLSHIACLGVMATVLFVIHRVSLHRAAVESCIRALHAACVCLHKTLGGHQSTQHDCTHDCTIAHISWPRLCMVPGHIAVCGG